MKTMKTLHIIQHVDFEGAGAIADWCKLHKIEIKWIRLWQSDYKLPAADQIQALAILGGPMGIYDEDLYEWLSEEKDLIRQYLALDRPVLGICLGAQLLADALGSIVYPGAHKEIGFFPIQAKADKCTSLLSSFPDQMEVLHWHGDTFDLPSGAQLLYSSAACDNQAFQWQSHVLALQFHLECNSSSLDSLILHSRSELASPGAWIQKESEILLKSKVLGQLNRSLFHLLDRFYLNV